MIYTKQDFSSVIDVSAQAFAKLEIYDAVLLKWNKAINLVSPKTIDQVWHRHFIDSAQVAKFIPEDTKIYADLGCGAGFPGLVIAIMHPDLETHLVESDERKCQFMRTVVREVGLKNVIIHTKRIENVIDEICPDFITARALSSLEVLFDYCLPWAEANKSLGFCFMKGERSDKEISEAKDRFNFDYKMHDSITDNTARLLSIRNLEPMI